MVAGNGGNPGLRLAELAASASRHGILVTDPNLPDNPIVYANPAFEKVTGYAPGKILGRNCRFLQNGDTDQADLEAVRAAVREGRECRVVLRNYKEDGTPFWNDLSISPVHDEDGRLIFFVGVQEDVTERKQMADALREAEERYHSIFESSVEGIFQTSVDGRILAANPAMARIFGYESPEEMIEAVTNVGEQLYEDPAGRRELLRLLEERGSVSGFETRVRRRDGGAVWISTSAHALYEGGRMVGIQGTVEDITERRLAEEALREQTETLEKLNRVGQMLSSELDGQKLAQVVTDEATRLTGASFGAFLNVVGGGDSYTLHAVSGLSREAFAKLHVARSARVFGPALSSGEVVRSDDVRAEGGYGDAPAFWGAAEGVPVASYLAVPVVSRSGEVLGGLFFGHPEPGVFGEHEEGIATALAAQAAVAMDNARLFESVRENEERYRVLYEDNPSMYLTLDEGGTVLSVNRFGAEQLGYEPDELVGRRMQDLFHEDDEEILTRNLSACLKNPNSLCVWEARKMRKDGSVLWVEERANAVRTAGGGRIVLVVCEDITERKRAEEALREVREAERARIARDIHDEALQDIVHALQQIELRKALAREGTNTAELDEVSAALKRSVEGLRGAIYDLRLEGHHEQTFPEMLSSLAKMNRRRAPGQEIEASVGADLPLDKDGQVELLRIIQEALTNARRHSKARTVSVTVEASNNTLRAEVSDDGVGFHAEEALGMGVRNMRERARTLGGDLEVESRPGEGTTVRFEMPLGDDDAEENVARILLVEDHASFRQAIASVLDRAPEFEVVGQAGSLAEARERLGAEPVDVALVDLGLPDGYGGELIKELRDANPDAQALVLSASLDRSEIARAVEYGAAGVMHKTVGMSEVVEAVRRLRAGETLLPLSEIVELLRFAGTRRKEEHEARHALSQLTPREREVLQALAEGLDGREIAERLRISVTTERNHMARILAKLGVHSRLQALVFALRYGAVEIG
ncbi:PAS domain S-box protein [Rubrobacter marinus]|uniref:PAS domain S-box protein n=1 Tax=Rubrobacter marinus TaxID=2653852 RepID=UPI00140C3344|nr:PAS domain S-box protein [Rubrobacter marinus]